MPITYRQAEKKDFENIISLLNKCFNKDFKAILPKIYLDDENAYNHHLLEDDGKIVAVIAVFVNKQYGFSFVGNVAIDPDYQNRGLLQKLMDIADEFNKQNKVNFSFLTGSKHLYEKYGYYRVGASCGFRFIEESMKYLKPNIYNDIYFMTVEPSDSRALFDLYKGSSKVILRDEKNFQNVAFSYNGRLLKICKNGAIIGYFIINQMGMVGELVLEKNEYFASVIHLLNQQRGESIVMMNHDNPLYESAKRYSETLIHMSFLSAKIYDFNAFMKFVFLLDQDYEKKDNSLALNIDGKNYSFTITNNSINVCETLQESSIKMSMKEFATLFTPEGLENTNLQIRSLFPIFFDIPTSDHY